MPPTIVPMLATNVPAVLAIHRQAFAGYPHVALGDAYLRRMLGWYASDPDALAFVAAIGDQVVGYVVGTDRAGAERLGTHLRSAAIFGMVTRPWLLGRADVASALLRRLIPSRSGWSPDLGTHLISLAGIGVDLSHRRSGLGRALLTAFEEQAAARRAEVLTLSVEPGNAAARRLYESSGWQQADTQTGRLLTYLKRVDPRVHVQATVT